jgi:hypothetical protein
VLVLLARIFWRRLAKPAQLAAGRAILPARMRWWASGCRRWSFLAQLRIIAVFLAAYGIPVASADSLGERPNSVSNSVSVTPGGVGVTQAMNTAALANSTSTSTATAYSVAQQLIVSAWDVVFAIVLVSWVFGWSGGRELVQSSYGRR